MQTGHRLTTGEASKSTLRLQTNATHLRSQLGFDPLLSCYRAYFTLVHVTITALVSNLPTCVIDQFTVKEV